MIALAESAAPTALPAGAASLRFDATVPRQLVHRAAISETFLTDAVEVAADRFLVAAQLPRSHSLYNDGPGTHPDLLLLVEVVRQAGTLVSHRFYGVPEGSVFPMRRAQVELTDLDAAAASHDACEMVADIRMFDHQRQSGKLSSMSLFADVFLGGRPIGSVSGATHFVSPSSYGALRGSPSPAGDGSPQAAMRRADPRRVGRRDPRNVVVSELRDAPREQPYGCSILADTGHPSYFDHPQDHVPGMVLLEGYRQLALLAVADACAWAPASLLVVACDASFTRYAELGHEALCSATVGEPVLPRRGAPWVPLALEIAQQGRPLSTATARVAAAGR
jgi:2-oxo-3-(phosphooxy)propyl 3-oxoalkanoate synthase